MKIWSEFQMAEEFGTKKEAEAFVLFLEKDGKVYHCAMAAKAVREVEKFGEISNIIFPMLSTLLRVAYQPIQQDKGKVNEEK
jgi:hypothetical protein